MDDEQRRTDGSDVVVPWFQVGRAGSTAGADAEVPVVDVSIVLPHDGIISTLFFSCWARETRAHQLYRSNRKSTGVLIPSVKGC